MKCLILNDFGIWYDSRFDMKYLTLLLGILLMVSQPVFADLTVQDLEKIREIVAESETRMKENITSSENSIKVYIAGEIDKVNTKITEIDKRLTNQIHAVDTQVGRNFYLVLGLIALIAVAVGLPQIITAWQGSKLREQMEKYEELKQEIEMLKQ